MVKLRKMNKMKERGPGSPPGSRFLPIGRLAGPAGGIVTALLKNWKIAVFAVLVAIIAYQNTMKWEVLSPFGLRTIPGMIQDYEAELAEAEEKVRIAQEQVVECDLSRERLKGEIAATNEQIERWSALSNRLQANANNLSAELIKLKKQGTTEIQVILDGPIPQTCEGAVKLLRDAATSGELR